MRGDTVREQRGDIDLADRLRAGHGDALGELFDRYGDRVHAHCFRRLGDWQEAEDATGSAFLEVWRHRERVVLHDDSLLPWLLGVATNVSRNFGRGHRRRSRLARRVPSAGSVPDHAAAVVDRLDAEVRMKQVLAAVRTLPMREQEVLALVAWSGLTYEQAAAALDVPVGTVRSRLSRARARLTQGVGS